MRDVTDALTLLYLGMAVGAVSLSGLAGYGLYRLYRVLK